MGILKKLFGSRDVTLRELRLTLMSHERQRRRTGEELQKLENRQARVMEQARRSRRRNDQLDVDYRWEELKQLRAESSLLRRDARILNLETITLKRTIHGMERLEAMNDKAGVRNLLRRVRDSGLDDKLAAGAIREEEYLRELEAILDESGVPEEVSADDDPEKAAFIAELDAMNAAEPEADERNGEKRAVDIERRLEAEEDPS